MVINIGKALQGDWKYVKNEIREVTEVCHQYKAIIKVIFETDYVTREEDIVKLCEICTEVGADYVKTSTGYGFVKQANGDYNYAGATIPVLELMKKNVGPKVKVKAAGGVRNLDQLLAVQAAGASRCGATATASMIEDAIKRLGE
jgi:deoxyribose-phosphate aldolase